MSANLGRILGHPALRQFWRRGASDAFWVMMCVFVAHIQVITEDTTSLESEVVLSTVDGEEDEIVEVVEEDKAEIVEVAHEDEAGIVDIVDMVQQETGEDKGEDEEEKGPVRDFPGIVEDEKRDEQACSPATYFPVTTDSAPTLHHTFHNHMLNTSNAPSPAQDGEVKHSCALTLGLISPPLSPETKKVTRALPAARARLPRPSNTRIPVLAKVSAQPPVMERSGYTRTMASLARQKEEDEAKEEAERVRGVEEKKRRYAEVRARKERAERRRADMKKRL